MDQQDKLSHFKRYYLTLKELTPQREMKRRSGCVWRWERGSADRVLTLWIVFQPFARSGSAREVCAADVLTFEMFYMQAYTAPICSPFCFFCCGSSPVFNRDNSGIQHYGGVARRLASGAARPAKQLLYFQSLRANYRS